eukprot:Gb_41504 [translate_table: standard]
MFLRTGDEGGDSVRWHYKFIVEAFRSSGQGRKGKLRTRRKMQRVVAVVTLCLKNAEMKIPISRKRVSIMMGRPKKRNTGTENVIVIIIVATEECPSNMDEVEGIAEETEDSATDEELMEEIECKFFEKEMHNFSGERIIVLILLRRTLSLENLMIFYGTIHKVIMG